MKLFKELGREIEDRWRACNYDEQSFPAIAAEKLTRFSLPEKMSSAEILEWTVGQSVLPEQRDLKASFGDPPVTLFNGPRFHIDAYFWLEGTTSIHQHAFCGAFQVLEGSSLHTQFSFESEKEINGFCRVGVLNAESTELLCIGDVQQIHAGEKYIHSLFHLDHPSVTIVVRTHLSPMDLPQFSYLKPGFAIDPFFEEPNTIKKIQVLRTALRAGYENADVLVKGALAASDIQTNYEILKGIRPALSADPVKELFDLDESVERFESFLQIVRENHPEYADTIDAVFVELNHTDTLLKLRNVITNAEHRFFLALLLNLDQKERILSVVKKRFPSEDPVEKVLDWISDLGNTKVLDGSLPNGLSVEGYTDLDSVVLQEMMEMKTDTEIVSALSATGEAPENEKIMSSIERIRNASTLRALLN